MSLTKYQYLFDRKTTFVDILKIKNTKENEEKNVYLISIASFAKRNRSSIMFLFHKKLVMKFSTIRNDYNNLMHFVPLAELCSFYFDFFCISFESVFFYCCKYQSQFIGYQISSLKHTQRSATTAKLNGKIVHVPCITSIMHTKSTILT